MTWGLGCAGAAAAAARGRDPVSLIEVVFTSGLLERIARHVRRTPGGHVFEAAGPRQVPRIRDL
jgi:hypothetical protein